MRSVRRLLGCFIEQDREGAPLTYRKSAEENVHVFYCKTQAIFIFTIMESRQEEATAWHTAQLPILSMVSSFLPDEDRCKSVRSK